MTDIIKDEVMLKAGNLMRYLATHPDVVAENWASSALTDIHHLGFCPGGKDVHHGDHGAEETAPPPVVHAGVQGGDRGAVTETAVRTWVAQAETDAGERPGLTSSEREELARLRRENRSLREDVEVLKRATAFFAKETR